MLPVFIVVGLALVVAAVAFLVRGSSRPPSPEANASPASASGPTLVDAIDQLVLVVGPPAADITQVCTEFRALYQERELAAYSFQLHAVEPGITALTFPQNLPAEFFYYLINYLSYPESSYSISAQVQGWATLPIRTRGKTGAPPEPVLVCVPPDDTRYDVVLLVTPAPAVYQVFCGDSLPIPLHHTVPVAYAAPPYSLEIVRQIQGTELR